MYRPGRTNIADSLSRLNNDKDDKSGDKVDFVRELAIVETPVALTPKQIEVESESDQDLIEVWKCIRSGDWSHCKLTGYVAVKSELCLVGKLVLRGNRLVIPHSLRNEVLQLAQGHQGSLRRKRDLESRYGGPKWTLRLKKSVSPVTAVKWLEGLVLLNRC